MAPCGICARKTCDIPLRNDTGFKYSVGDVYGLKESVYTPIFDILQHTFSKLDGQVDALKRNQRSLHDLKHFSNIERGSRPAVITEYDDGDDPLGLMVCVATTYGKDDISKLPLIFRHFSIPIAFNGDTSPNHSTHIHALPEWDRENAYIIAWQFKTTAILDGTWTAQVDEDSGKVPQVFGKDGMEFLLKECARRKEEWERMCKDPEVAAKLEAELRTHVEHRWRQKRLSVGTSTTSFDSMATGVDSPSWRSTAPGPSTIPEESGDNGMMGNPQEPEPWKVVTKHRPGSMRSFSSAFSKKASSIARDKGANWDKFSTKSNRSRSSFSQKPHKVNGMRNFDLLLAVKGR